MSLIHNNRNIDQLFHNQRQIAVVYHGYRIVWENQSEYQSCFANGLWKDSYPWTDNLPWKD